MASALVASVVEELLSHKQSSYGLFFCLKDLNTLESDFVERLVVLFLEDYLRYVDIASENHGLAVNLKQSLDSIQDRIPVLCRAE
jgi:hypothetical protein